MKYDRRGKRELSKQDNKCVNLFLQAAKEKLMTAQRRREEKDEHLRVKILEANR